MTALHTALARTTLPDVNPKRPDDDARHRQFFLILHRQLRLADRPAAVRTAARQRRLIPLIDAARPLAMRLRSVLRPRFASRAARMSRERFGKRRGLPMRRAPRFVQLALQSVDLSTQPLTLALQSLVLALQLLVLVPQSITLALRAFGTLTQLVDLARLSIIALVWRRLRHAAFMSDSREKYKYGILDLPRQDCTVVRTR